MTRQDKIAQLSMLLELVKKSHRLAMENIAVASGSLINIEAMIDIEKGRLTKANK